MNVESLREFCLSLPQVTECFPFDEWVLVFKIEGKMFLFCDLSAEEKRISLKCDPELAIELRERYPEIEPGYHTNKRLWNSIWLRPSIDDKVICDCIVHAYSEVLKKTTQNQTRTFIGTTRSMETKEIKFQKTHLKEIGSTNTYLQESDKDRHLPEGTIIYCDIQRSGRGQRGNSWESEPYKNLTFSLLLRPEHIPANRQFLLSEIVSLATVDVLNRYATGFSIKWPNDIYWHDKKNCRYSHRKCTEREYILTGYYRNGAEHQSEKFLQRCPQPGFIISNNRSHLQDRKNIRRIHRGFRKAIYRHIYKLLRPYPQRIYSDTLPKRRGISVL